MGKTARLRAERSEPEVFRWTVESKLLPKARDIFSVIYNHSRVFTCILAEYNRCLFRSLFLCYRLMGTSSIPHSYDVTKFWIIEFSTV